MLCEDWTTPDQVTGGDTSGGDACGPCAPRDDEDPIDPATIVLAITLASEILYGLTGEQFGGLCTQTVRPCARRCRPRGTIGRGRPFYEYPDVGIGGAWNGATCSCRPNACGCTRLHRVELPAWPVAVVLEVKIDGDLLDPSAYRVDEEQFLTRIDGDAWPACQDLELADTEPDTFSVRFTSGTAIPPGGAAAAAKYACELARSWCGHDCELPSRVSSITRQGVTLSFESAGQLVQNGQTGVLAVDSWIRAVNGGDGQLQAPMLIASPDTYPLAYRPGG